MLLSYQPKRARFSEILLALKAQIVAKAVVPPAAVAIVATDERPPTKAEKLVYLRPRRFTAAQAQKQAAGRLDARLERLLDVFVDTRAISDPVNSDEIWLTDPARGIFDVEEAVIEALDGFTPTDSFGNSLTLYDVRILAGAQPDKNAKALGWGKASATIEVAYMPPVSLVDISPDTLPAGTVGAAYNQTFTQVGSQGMAVIGATPAWTVSGGLPAGLSISGSSGTITGTPTTAGDYTFTVTVTDGGPGGSGLGGWHRYTLSVGFTIAPTTLPAASQGLSYSQTLTTSGATGSVAWTLNPGSGGALPAGLTLGNTTGIISGTPMGSGVATFTVLATDLNGHKGKQTYTVRTFQSFLVPSGGQNVMLTLPEGTALYIP